MNCKIIDGSIAQAEEIRRRVGRPLSEVSANVLGVMGFHDAPVTFRISPCSDKKELAERYKSTTGIFNFKAKAFTARGGVIHVSVQDVSLRILAHEMAHATLFAIYSEPIPLVLHELIAQTVEERVCKKYSWWRW